MFKKPLSVQQLLMWGFLLTALLPMLTVMWLAFYQARSALREEITRDMQTRATGAFNEVDNMMFERLQNMVSWSRLEVMHEVVIGDIDKRLSNFLNEIKNSYRGVYQTLYVVNSQDIVIASSEPAQIGKPANGLLPEKSPWKEVQFANHTIHFENIQQQRLPMSIPIKDLDGNKIGTLWVWFDWNYISAILKSTEIKGSSAALLDEEGNELAYTEDWLKIRSAHNISTHSNPANLLSGQNGTPSVFNWQVVISQYRAVAMQPVQRMGFFFIFLLLVTAFLTTALAALLTRSITKPLAKLTDYANHFMRSSQATLPPADGPSEVRAMSDAFSKMMNDLTQSKENLTRAAKLAVAGEMAAAMSHEVRTPLGILRSSAQVLSREKNLSAEGLEVTAFITTETERLNKLVSTLVDSARPRQPEFAMHDIVGLVEHAMAMLRMQANKKDISLVFASGNFTSTESLASTQLFVECDGEQITQVILNLVLNAIQVLPTGGNIMVSLFETKDNVTISVADDGAGVDEAQKEHIFDPFFTQRPGGIGLGLAVSRQIVTAHFGTLTVEKNQAMQNAGGADFRVTLPKLQIHT